MQMDRPVLRAHRAIAAAFAVGALLLMHASAGQAAPDPRAANFASKGFSEALRGCRLPETCGGRRPRSSQHEPVRETGNDNIVEEHDVRFEGLEVWFLFVLGN